MDKRIANGIRWLIVVALVVVSIGLVVLTLQMNDACRRSGGVLVRSVWPPLVCMSSGDREIGSYLYAR